MATEDNVTSWFPAPPPPPRRSFGDCGEWREAQDVVYQVANLFFAVAFLVPDEFRCHVTVMRASVCVGCGCVVVWGGVTLCQVDVLVWYLIFLSVNLFHLVYGVAECWPTALRPELRVAYARLFAPLRVTRSEFEELTELGCFKDLPNGELYASQGDTVIGERLSLLLSGRLKVTRGWLFLHSITPCQFIDSPEYHDHFAQLDTAATSPTNARFQVSVTAVESCRMLTWSIPELSRYLQMRPFVGAVLNGLLGRDVTRKIAQVHELFLANPQYTCTGSVAPPQSTSAGSGRGADDDGSSSIIHRVEPGGGGGRGGGTGSTCSGGGWEVHRLNSANRTPIRPQVINLQEGVMRLASSSSASSSSNGQNRKGTAKDGVNTKLVKQKAETPIGPYSPSQVSYETFV